MHQVTQQTDARRFLSKEECSALAKRVIGYAQGGGYTFVGITSEWTGELRWARNRASVAGDRRNNRVTINRVIQQSSGNVETNQIDDLSLKSAVLGAERLLRLQRYSPAYVVEKPTEHEYPQTHIWSDTTYAQTPDERSAIARALIDPAESAGLMSAGYLSVTARGNALIDSATRAFYAPQTIAQCSMTVRDPKGLGSGWAGASSYDWSRFDAEKLTQIALKKCIESRNPVAIEPGRYTVILEPQAAFTFADMLVGNRESAEFSAMSPFWSHREEFVFERRPGALGVSKIGERVLDERITISHDPTDPDLGVIPFSVEPGLYGPEVEPYSPVTWFRNGVLETLSYPRQYAIRALSQNLGRPHSGAFRMSGGTTSPEEMIETTKRGVLVTRFSNVRIIDPQSLLCTGTTRDGIWLIENGKVNKPVKNFRFMESPFFVFNNVEQLGTPVPVFSPESPAIVPPVKVRDFNFSSLVDAI